MMRGIIVALVPLTATTLEPTTRRRAAQRLAAAAVTLAPLESNAIPPIPLPEGRPPPEVTALVFVGSQPLGLARVTAERTAGAWAQFMDVVRTCLLYTSPSPRD